MCYLLALQPTCSKKYYCLCRIVRIRVPVFCVSGIHGKAAVACGKRWEDSEAVPVRINFQGSIGITSHPRKGELNTHLPLIL